MKRIAILFVAAQIVCVSSLLAQSKPNKAKLMSTAIKHFEAHDYGEALKNFEDVLEIDPANSDAKLYAAVCYLNGDNPIKGYEYLNAVKNTPSAKSPLFNYWLGIAEYKNERFEEAEKHLAAAAQQNLPALQPKIAEIRQYVSNAKELKKTKSIITVSNLGDKINSADHEYGSFLSSDYKTLYFTREPFLLGKQNKSLEQGVTASLSSDGMTWENLKPLKIALTDQRVEVPIQLFDNDQKLLVYVEGNLMVSELTSDGWGELKPFQGGVTKSSTSKSRAFIFNKGNSLIFASDYNSAGNLDLYEASFDPATSKWSEPKLIKELSTDKNEDAPFVSEDGTLYFSSEGFNSAGGYDIFKTRFDPTTGKWETPVNMGFPVNSVFDDIFFTTTGIYGYFTSNRSAGYGKEDLYIAYLEPETDIKLNVKSVTNEPLVNPEVSVVMESGKSIKANAQSDGSFIAKLPINSKGKIKVFSGGKLIHEEDVKTRITLDGKKLKDLDITVRLPEDKKGGIAEDKAVTIMGKLNKAPAGTEVSIVDQSSGKTVATTKINKDGSFKLSNITYGSKSDYLLTATSKGNVIAKNSISAKNIRNGETIDLGEISMITPPAIGDKILTEMIYFDFNSFVIREVSYPILDQIVTYLNENKSIRIEIGGHTDSIGKDEYNQVLSQRRANSVKQYLTSKGISANRLVAVGYGEKKPIASNDEEEQGRELNRRIEFKVIK